MLIDKEAVIKFIEDKTQDRIDILVGLHMCEYENEKQFNMFLGVNMVIRWIKEFE
jgi:hypothetical protein